MDRITTPFRRAEPGWIASNNPALSDMISDAPDFMKKPAFSTGLCECGDALFAERDHRFGSFLRVIADNGQHRLRTA